MGGLLGDGFRFGVATAGFQVEGGFNGPCEPRNNWYEWEAAGKVEPSGIAVDFWNDYERHLDRAASTGVDSYRLSIECGLPPPNRTPNYAVRWFHHSSSNSSGGTYPREL